jgi:DNA-binding transcriptional ArsR family regulator
LTLTRSQAVFHAIAEPTRRKILDALVGGPRGAGALARRFPTSRPSVARHLRVLLQSGLVLVRSEGRRRVYTLNPASLLAVVRWIARYERLSEARDPGRRQT